MNKQPDTVKSHFKLNRALSIIILLSLITVGFTDPINKERHLAEPEKLQMENDSLKSIIDQNETTVNQKIIAFLTFQNEDAEQAMNFYIGLFDNSRIVDLKRWGKEAPGKEGTIMHASFSLNGQLFMCSDSPPVHDWDFTPAVSNYVECEDESEIERLFERLSENGEVAMPLNIYGFSRKFGWVVDQFGVSWQLNLQ